MKKKALLLASMGVLACTVGVTALAFGGANQLDTFPVKVNATGYEITFDESNYTTIEEVNGNYAIWRTTPSGVKVGVMGQDKDGANFTFKGKSFESLRLWLCEDEDGELDDVGAYQFSTITGFAISFPGEEDEPVPVDFIYGEKFIPHVERGYEYKNLSITPDNEPEFMTSEPVTVTSLTIWYSC